MRTRLSTTARFQFGGEAGATPAHATPPEGLWGTPHQGPQRPLQAGAMGARRGRSVRFKPQVEVAAPIGRDRPINAGARAEESRSDGGRPPTRGTEQEDAQREQMPLAGAAQFGQYLLLLSNSVSQVSLAPAQTGHL